MQKSTPSALLLNWWCKCQHWGFYCWTCYAKVNNKVFTAELEMHKSTLRDFLLNWWCKTQHRCLYCWTGDANVKTEVFTAELVIQRSTPTYFLLNWWWKVNAEVLTTELVMQKSTPRSLLLNWWCIIQHRGLYCWTGDANIFYTFVSKTTHRYQHTNETVVVMIVWLLDLQLPMLSVSITTKVLSLNPTLARCTRYINMW